MGIKSKESQANEILNKYDNLLDFYSYYMQPISHQIGMTLEQFWYDDPSLFFAYLEAYNQQKKDELNEKLFLSHLNGQYTCLALAQMFSKKQIFPDKPISVDEKPKQTSIEEQNEKWRCYLMSKLKVKNK